MSGCSSVMAASSNTGTDAPMRLSGSRRLGIKVVWVGTRDEQGVLYFWHKVTRVSRNDLPPLPPE